MIYIISPFAVMTAHWLKATFLYSLDLNLLFYTFLTFSVTSRTTPIINDRASRNWVNLCNIWYNLSTFQWLSSLISANFAKIASLLWYPGFLIINSSISGILT